MQIYLSINRPDLARKEFERAKRWAGDDMLVQLVEAFIGMVTGKDGYQDCNSFYDEQLGNPSLTSPHLLTARGITRLLRGEVVAAKSDFEEVVLQNGGRPDAETLGAMTVAAGLTQAKSNEAEQLWSSVTLSLRPDRTRSRPDCMQPIHRTVPEPPNGGRPRAQVRAVRRAVDEVHRSSTRDSRMMHVRDTGGNLNHMLYVLVVVLMAYGGFQACSTSLHLRAPEAKARQQRAN